MSTFSLLQESNKMTTQELDYLALTIVRLLKNDRPKWISQNKAYATYGRTRVERLRAAGRVATSKVGNSIKYRLIDLEKAEGIKIL